MALQGLMQVNSSDSWKNPSPKRLESDYRCRKRICKVREYERVSLLVINGLRLTLGPTNP